MRRSLRSDERRLWAVVASTVKPAAGRIRPVPPPLAPEQAALPSAGAQAARTAPTKSRTPSHKLKPTPPSRMELQVLEPQRRRRIGRGRDLIEDRLDLHGLDQNRARQALHDFLLSARARGARSVLIITGKGTGGQGVLRRRTPEWLSDPPLREAVAGIAPAEPHHGGDGALYVALKRRPR